MLLFTPEVSYVLIFQWFPFDDQFCKMKFGSWSYDGTKINLVNSSHEIDVSTYQMSGEWDLISKKTP